MLKLEQAMQSQSGSIGPASSRKRALRILARPWSVNSVPLEPRRVGSTQSNMSTPSPTAGSRSSGRPTARQGGGGSSGELGGGRGGDAHIDSFDSPTERPPML